MLIVGIGTKSCVLLCIILKCSGQHPPKIVFGLSEPLYNIKRPKTTKKGLQTSKSCLKSALKYPILDYLRSLLIRLDYSFNFTIII